MILRNYLEFIKNVIKAKSYYIQRSHFFIEKIKHEIII